MVDQLIIFGGSHLYIAAVLLFVVFFFMQSKTYKQHMFIVTSIALPLIYISAKIGSYFYFNPRPFVVEHITPLIPHIADNGFPSDHMLLTSALAAVIFSQHRAYGLVAWGIAILVGISRVFTHVHHLTDIIGSAMIASIGVYFVTTYVVPKLKKYIP